MAYTPVVNRTSGVPRSGGYTPVAKRSTTPAKKPLDLGNPSFPSVATSASTPSVLTPELKQQRQNVLAAGASTIGTLAASAGQGIARAWAATGARLASQIKTATTDLVDPKSFFGDGPTAKKVGQVVFGKTEPFNATTEDIEFLEAFGADPAAAAKTGGSLTMMLSALDLTGVGGSAKGLAGAIRSVRAAKTAEEALKLGKELGLADDIAQQYADVFVKARTAPEAKAALEAAAKLQNATKTVSRSYTPVAARAERLQPSPELSSLAKLAEVSEALPTQKAGITGKALEERSIVLELQREALDNNPAKQLAKFVNRNSEIPENTGKGTGKFSREGDQIVTELGFTNSEDARDAYQVYREQKLRYEEDLQAYKADLKIFQAETKDIELVSKPVPVRQIKNTAASPVETGTGAREALPLQTPREVLAEILVRPSDTGQPILKQPKLQTTSPNPTPLRSRVHDEAALARQPVQVSEALYQQNRAAFANKPSKLQRIRDGLSASGASLQEGLDKLLGSISTRLKNIDPSLKRAIRDFEYKLGVNTQRDRQSVAPFLKALKTKKLEIMDYADLDLALKNGDLTKTNEIIAKYDLEEDFAKVRGTLESLYERAEEVGFDIGYRRNYFPRMIEDAAGLLQYFQKGDDWSIIEEAIRAKETELGRYLNVKEKANLINTLIRGYGTGGITLSETGAMKARRIDFVDAQLNTFYRSSPDALLRYIDTTNDAIEARRFFGKGSNTDQFANLDDSIGSYVMDLVAARKIKPSQEIELRNILHARFAEVGTSGVVQVYKNLSYIDTMGSVASAITQIGDLAFAVYKAGPVNTAKALGKAIVGKSELTKTDIGIERIAQEFSDDTLSAKAVTTVFKLIGLEKMDTLGKETLINATISRYRDLANNPTREFQRKIEAVFGDDPELLFDVTEELKAGKTTENVKLLAFNELLDVQPAALSEMPEMYLTGGNGRIFYMLKTYTIKLFDVYRNEVFQQIATDPAKGLKNLVYLSAALMAMNATADEIKDLILNRETSLKDRTVDNILKLAGFTKFTIYKAREEGIGSAAARTILPPFKFIDSAYKDIIQATEISKLETIQSIPIGGKLYYWWFGKGADKTAKKRSTPTPKSVPTPPGLPKLPSAVNTLPKLPSLPTL